MSYRWRHAWMLLVLCSGAVAVAAVGGGTRWHVPGDDAPTASVHLALGMPRDADSTDDYLIIRPQYALSYNRALLIPNWVSWRLDSASYGPVPRYDGKFIQDRSLPAGWKRATHADYTNTPYERGHVVRSEERTASEEDNRSTFLLTNVLPQRADLNKGVWLDFERWCQAMCTDSSADLYVVAGGIVRPVRPKRIGRNRVAVPDSCWKIVVVLPRGGGLEDVTAATRVEAVIIPNRSGIRARRWREYRRTVDEIEAATGYDVLTLVPAAIQDVIERRR